jgi:hypothetical protein
LFLATPLNPDLPTISFFLAKNEAFIPFPGHPQTLSLLSELSGWQPPCTPAALQTCHVGQLPRAGLGQWLLSLFCAGILKSPRDAKNAVHYDISIHPVCDDSVPVATCPNIIFAIIFGSPGT